MKNETIKTVKSRFGLRKRELYSLLHIYHTYYKKGITTDIRDIYVKFRPIIERGYIRPVNNEITKNIKNSYNLTEKGYITLIHIAKIDSETPFTNKEIELIINEYNNII